MALAREGRTEESFAALERALAHAEAAGDQVHATGRDRAAWRLGSATGRHRPRRRSSGSTSSEPSTRNDPVLDAGLCLCRAQMLAMAGRFDEASEHIVASSASSTRPDQSILSLHSRAMVGQVKELAGDLAGAKQDVLTSFLSMRDARGEGSEARALKAAAELALLCCDEGDWDEAAEYLSYGRQVDESEPPGARPTPSCASPPGLGSPRIAASRRSARAGPARSRAHRAESLAPSHSPRLARARRGAASERQ